MPAKVTEQPTRPTTVVSIMDTLRKSIAVEAAKSAAGKPKAEPAPAEDVAPQAKGSVEGEGQGPQPLSPAPAAQKARKAK